MKKFLIIFTAILSFVSFSDESEKVSVIIGSTKTVENPFVIESYRLVPSDSKCIRVEVAESQIRLIANAVGTVNLIVSGGGLSKDYNVTVRSNLSIILRKLRNDLASLTELDISINEDEIIIRGTVTNPEHWFLLQRVLPAYRRYCRNFAVFSPSAETLQELRNTLANAGFTFCEPGGIQEVGQLMFRHSRDTITISGQMYSRESVDLINRILNNVSWLSNGLVKKIVNISLVPTVLEVSVAFVSLSDSDDFTRTGNINPTGGFNAHFLRQWLDGNRREKTLGFNADMGGTLSFLQTNLVSKVMDQGTVTFANGSPDGGTYKFGGNIKVPVSGVNSAELVDVSYGYDVSVKGGLVSEKQVRLKMDLKSQDVTTNSKGDYDQKNNSASLTLPMELDKTYIVAHHKKKSESSAESSFPVLGRIPILKWFFSDSSDISKEVNVLVLVSVRVKTMSTQYMIDMKTGKSIEDAGRSTRDRMKAPIKENIKKDIRNMSR